MIARLLLGLLLSAPALTRADVRLPAIFGDHMVLQQDIKIPVWGWADPGERIKVTLGPRTVSAVADSSGRWRVDFDPIRTVTDPIILVVSGKNTLTLRDVLVGEVWLAAGQSNMEYGVGGDVRSRETLAKADQPKIRLFSVPSETAMIPLRDLKPSTGAKPSDLLRGKWQVCTPETLRQTGVWNGFPAAAYYFGHSIQESTTRPVGLIASTRGGTDAKVWLGIESLRQPPAFPDLVKHYETERAKRSANLEDSIGGGIPGIPASVYNATIVPLAPYALRGVLWYQGESNSPRPAEYELLFPRLIADWRTLWQRPELPFLFVQLAAFESKPSEDWPRLREAQAKALALPATGMAVALDLGHPRDVHPNDKIDLGHRLALVARRQVYGETQLVATGPAFKSAKTETGGRIRLRFDSVGGGLIVGTPPPDSPLAKLRKPSSELLGFVIAGADRRWFPASARIEADTVLVSSPSVPAPVAVRYAWAAAPEANLYNRENLPAAPFRTDDWPRTADPALNNIPQAAAWLDQCSARLASFKNQPCDLLFIGDSLTQNFVEPSRPGWNLVGGPVLEKHYAPRRALNLGVGGDSIQNALWRLDTMDGLKDLRPKVVIVMLGMNNASDTPEDIAGGLRAVIDKSRLLFPDARIVLMSVTPNGRMTEKTPLINARLRALAADTSTTFVDLYAQMPATGPAAWKGVGGDKIHLTQEGYELWAATLDPVLTRLL